MDRYYASLPDHPKAFSDSFLTGYTAFFIALKNSENFHYLRLSDITTKFLCNNYSRKQILQKEFDIRKAVGYENETSTLFDFVLLLIKMWKISCQNSLGQSKQWLASTYHFMCEIEQQAYDLTKSTLIDAECHKFKPSLVVAALITAAIEINLNIKYRRKLEEITSKQHK